MKKLFAILFLSVVASTFAQSAPINKSAAIGSPVYIKLVSADGTAPFSYQWQKNGVDLAGQVGPTLAFPSIAVADVGTYTIKVINSAGQAISNPASITVTLIAPGNVIITFSPTP